MNMYMYVTWVIKMEKDTFVNVLVIFYYGQDQFNDISIINKIYLKKYLKFYSQENLSI